VVALSCQSRALLGHYIVSHAIPINGFRNHRIPQIKPMPKAQIRGSGKPAQNQIALWKDSNRLAFYGVYRKSGILIYPK
jgi:hypothetical protein